MNARVAFTLTLTLSLFAVDADAQPGRTKQEGARRRAESLHGLHPLHEVHAERH